MGERSALRQELLLQSAQERETFAGIFGDARVLANRHESAETQMREILALAIAIRCARACFEVVQESFRLVHVETALGFFFAGIHLEKDVEDFSRAICTGAGECRADAFQLFHRLDARDGVDAVGDNRRLLELVALHGANHVATRAFAIECLARLAELEFRLLHAVLAKVGSTERDGILHGFCRVELAHPNELHRFTATARNLAGFANPCFESGKVLAHFFESEFHYFFAFFCTNRIFTISSMCLCV